MCCDNISAEQPAPGAAALGRGAGLLPAFTASLPFLGACLWDAVPAAFAGAAAGPAGTIHNAVAAAAYHGTVIAKRAIEKGITSVVFDRGGFIYQGKIQALADAAREAGLKF